VVTGLGLVTPIGIGVPSFWEGVTTGRLGVRALTRFDGKPYSAKQLATDETLPYPELLFKLRADFQRYVSPGT